MTYAKVINGEIVENNRALPFSTETTSFGLGATAEDLAVHGYYPVIGTEPSYDKTYQFVDSVTYSFDGIQVNKTYNISNISIDVLKANKIEYLKQTMYTDEPVTFSGVTYNGGADSASAIMGAIQLAQSNLEPTVGIWDINNNTMQYSFADANLIAKTIANEFRTIRFARNDIETAINAIVIDPQGTYPDYASAKAALDLI